MAEILKELLTNTITIAVSCFYTRKHDILQKFTMDSTKHSF